MKISEVIAELQAKLDESGDCEMHVVNTDYSLSGGDFSEPATELVLTQDGNVLIL